MPKKKRFDPYKRPLPPLPNNNPKPKPKRKKRTKRKFRPLKLYAANAGTNRVKFTQTRSSDNSVRVSGYDLIYNTNEGIVEGPFCVVTCNPAYWEGTRIATIANSYSQYRPLHLSFDYYPQVSTMNNGNVICGTLWNNNSNTNNLQQTLATSNGGKIFPVYATARVPVMLKTNLNQNLFNFQGYLDTDTNPFTFLATTQQSANIIPGYFMVSYVYEFKNPIGEGYDYSTQVSTASDISPSDVWDTTTAVLLTSTNVAAIGTKFVVKIVDDAIQFFLGGSRVGVLADCIFKLFRSRPKSITKLEDDIIDLEQSNSIRQITFSFDYIENGTSVTNTFDLQKTLSLSDMVTFKVMISGADYAKFGGLFVKPVNVGTGRYNLNFLHISNCAETVPEGWYVLKTVNGPIVDYSVATSRYSNVNIDCDPAIITMQYKDSSPISCEIPDVDTFDAKPFTLADIALTDVSTLLGTTAENVIGRGSTVLVPYNNTTRLY